jgi:NAD(P)H-hydrate repair Nnr-like enzyme with NAD(P)H-hydrate dehydratase domain
LATAGTGDVLAGIMGALAAINFDEVAGGKAQLTDIAEAAVSVHTRAAEILASKGPIAALDLANAVSQALVSLRN